VRRENQPCEGGIAEPRVNASKTQFGHLATDWSVTPGAFSDTATHPDAFSANRACLNNGYANCAFRRIGSTCQ
jgi:hypothetical protein